MIIAEWFEKGICNQEECRNSQQPECSMYIAKIQEPHKEPRKYQTSKQVFAGQRPQVYTSGQCWSVCVGPTRIVWRLDQRMDQAGEEISAIVQLDDVISVLQKKSR